MSITQKEEGEKKTSALSILLPLLLLALLAAGAYYLFGTGGGGSKHHNEDHAAAATEAKKEEPAAVTTSTKESLKVKLANGAEIDAWKAGIEDKLVAFLNTDYKALGADSLKKIWFDFDNLNFKTGSAELTAESQKQIDNLTAVLKAYPTVKLKIGGYTDKTGDEATNKKLSDGRAATVKDALTKAGVGTQVTGAEGYGSAMAKYAADAPEPDRVKDRRVSVSVRL